MEEPLDDQLFVVAQTGNLGLLEAWLRSRCLEERCIALGFAAAEALENERFGLIVAAASVAAVVVAHLSESASAMRLPLVVALPDLHHWYC